MLSIILILISIFLSAKHFKKIKIFTLIIFVFSWITINEFNNINEKNGFIDVDTAYNRVWIYDFNDSKTGRPTKIM